MNHCNFAVPYLSDVLLFLITILLLPVDLFLRKWAGPVRSKKIIFKGSSIVFSLLCAIFLSRITIGSDIFSSKLSAFLSFNSYYFQLVCYAALLFSIYALKNEKKDEKNEYPFLLAVGTFGALIMVYSKHFFSFFLGAELLSIVLYVLLGAPDNVRAKEAALKYFIFSAVSACFFLFGLSLIYNASAGVDAVFRLRELSEDGAVFLSPLSIVGVFFVFVSLAMKLPLAPFHAWMPDVYQGASFSTLIYLSVMPKVGALSFLMKFLSHYHGLFMQSKGRLVLLFVWFLSFLSVAFGSFFALYQKNIKRLLSFSAISHLGWVLAGLIPFLTATSRSLFSSHFYFVVYAVTSILLFYLLSLLKREKSFETISRQELEDSVVTDDLVEMSDLEKFAVKRPLVSFIISICVLSMAGLPPLPGFFAKFFILKDLVEERFYWSSALLVCLSVVSCAYYLQFIKILYFSRNDGVEKKEA